MALTKAHNRMIDGAYANVMDFGAVSDGVDPTTGTDNAAAFQAAANTGKTVFIPKGNYRVSTVTFSTIGQRVVGEGMGQSFIFPVTGNSCFIVASDKIEISNLEFRGKTGTGQAAAVGDCIKFDAVTNNPAFTRHMEGCKVERVMFRNLKMNAIYVPHLLRESHIRECRFVGMGDAATDRSAIKMENQLGAASNINNIWIDSNMFYRFENPPINLQRSTLISPTSSAISFADIWITNNLIHGQLYDEQAAVETVQPGECDHVYIEDGTAIYVHQNHFTAVHPVYDAFHLVCGDTVCKSAFVTSNYFSTKSVVGGVTYDRASGTATGHVAFIWGLESFIVANNTMNAGINVDEFLFNNGAYTTTIDVCVQGNVSEAGTIVADYSGLGTWRGRIDVTNECTTEDNQTINGTLDVTAGDTSDWTRNSNALALRFKYNTATDGVFIGSPDPSEFQVSTNGGSPLLVVQSTNSTRPGANNAYSLGNGTFRWTEVFATNGTINTSDERQKQDIEALSDAEQRVAVALKGLVKRFRWKSAVEKKGDDARIHVGVIAQEVIAAFQAEGLDPFRYGIVCHDEWEDQYEDVYEDLPVLDSDDNPTGKTTLTVVGKEISIPAGNSYGVRYEQLLTFIISAL
jgi:hypothetical protein